MTRAETKGFAPDWVSPPGDTILDLVEERGWNQADLADRLGYSRKHVNQLVRGKAALSEDAALRLHRVLGGSVGFWLTREARYRERLATGREAELYDEWVDWLDALPVSAMMKAGAITRRRMVASAKAQIVGESLAFFGVASPERWRARCAAAQGAFRKGTAKDCDRASTAVWLRLGELRAERLRLPAYDRDHFIQALREIRELTVATPDVFEPRMRDLLQAAGVAFVLVPAVPKAGVSGVARWLNGNPLIQLSLFGKTNDRFWFSFFHEAAHVLLHADDRKSVWLDDVGGRADGDEAEAEADRWAANQLIPSSHAAELRQLGDQRSVRAFAQRVGVHPGIVVGRLQHERLMDFGRMNGLKARFEFSKESTAA